MKGPVVGINGDRCAVQILSGITVFDIHGAHDTEIGDTISGNLEALGGEILINETKRERISVFIEDWSQSPEIARKFLLYQY